MQSVDEQRAGMKRVTARRPRGSHRPRDTPFPTNSVSLRYVPAHGATTLKSGTSTPLKQAVIGDVTVPRRRLQKDRKMARHATSRTPGQQLIHPSRWQQ
jgi:hypothetical protein